MSKKNTTPETQVASTEVPTVTKVTPVNERRFSLVGDRPQVKSKQASTVLDILAASEDPMTIDEIAPLAAEKGLKAVGGVAPSVRYHLHHMTKEGITKVVNPTIVL